LSPSHRAGQAGNDTGGTKGKSVGEHGLYNLSYFVPR
jgi:hypothetical protein